MAETIYEIEDHPPRGESAEPVTPFIPGQRWISESEPELGLGTVTLSGSGRVEILFPAVGEKRIYASDNAPLKRVRFRVGETVKTRDDRTLIIKKVVEKDGLLVYVGDDQELSERGLSEQLSLSGPEERLFAARFDGSEDFELRRRTLTLLHRARKSPVRGFAGGRIDLIPHQLYIAQEVANRHAPRVMLSDEVGLGKTIEACLILHRLLLTGRANRILVLVPESLVHQWFVEMLRRFNVWLNIFDEERCAAIEAGEPGANPFLDDQLILASVNFLAASPRRSSQAAAAGWDMLVVDEAHHLAWSPATPSREYQMVQEISRQARGLLLLTATPEQLGIESHFARLRLLDPDRYSDLASFEAGANDYQPTADVAEKLLCGTTLNQDDLALLRRLFVHDAQLEPRLAEMTNSGGRAAPGSGSCAEARQSLLEDLLDMHGPGRVLFRNTRAAMPGFPKRSARLAKLDPGPAAADWLDRATTEFAVDAGDTALDASFDLAKDPRLLWLVELLQKLDAQKVLLICRRIEKVEAIAAALRVHLDIKTAVFHEGLTLVQRDRNAAWFAEVGGARLLICSEIGSEGRNFQFAHHLVLFDLPLNPELLEQRIGRLDRIGQIQDICLHVPFLAHSPQEVLARWYHEGLDAFETNLEGGNELLRMFGGPVYDLAMEFSVADKSAADAELADLLKKTSAARQEIRRVLEKGRDRLLEMNSFRPAAAQKIIDQIQAEARQPDLEDYLLDVFDHFGLQIEELAPHTWQLNPQNITTASFPSIPAEGMVATCDRARALAREDVGFLTWDHPMVTGAMDLLLGSEKGNCSFAVLPTAGERTLLLELIFILEPMALARLHADRFLPATPLRLVVNHKTEDVTTSYPSEAIDRKLKKGCPGKIIENHDLSRRTIPNMFSCASSLAQTQAAALRETAILKMNRVIGHEVLRLKTLAPVNDHIRPVEIKLAEAQQEQLAALIRESRLRLDSLRLIWKGPPEDLG